MTKGKYAARAANREARLDNELLVEKMAEIARLKRALANTERLLADERRDRGAIITARADELSAEQIKRVQDEAAAAATEHAADNEQTALLLAQWLQDTDLNVMPGELDGVFTRLVGAARTGEFLSAHNPRYGTRRFRRLSASDVRRINARLTTDLARDGWPEAKLAPHGKDPGAGFIENLQNLDLQVTGNE